MAACTFLNKWGGYMEENAFKAITIGAAVIITMTTVTFAMIYYSVVKESIGTIDDKQDVYRETEEIFYEKLQHMSQNNGGVIDGEEARNIIYKLEGKELSTVNLIAKNGKTEVAKINLWNENYTGQINLIGINSKINLTDKFKITNLELDEDRNVSINIQRI